MSEKNGGGGGVVCGSRVADHGVETVVVVSGVFHLADGPVGLHQAVFTVDNVTITGFMLGLVVTSVAVGNRVRELVFGVGLERCIYYYCCLFIIDAKRDFSWG